MYRKHFKGLIDRTLALISLMLLFPLLVFLGILIRSKLGSPIFFKQKRPGKDEEIFTLYKFRSMSNKKDDKGELLSDEIRLGRFGKFLRSSSMDELPELWNILKGEMSFVGPRPLLIKYLNRYTPEQARRHEVKPGLTGWAQVNGRNSIGWEEKFKLDVWYVDNYTLGLDLKIIALTFIKVFKRADITSQHDVTMEEFLGTKE
ncbi:sugar transferase [Anoxybacterium hadale]|uniref:Sugar transferase n=1 Tax=Anoxybacterium hadale TaxID=3408580 RepID=A0ACD1AF36_9FIRM|nr:sugar transferase [Clostridiales bacterium]